MIAPGTPVRIINTVGGLRPLMSANESAEVASFDGKVGEVIGSVNGASLRDQMHGANRVRITLCGTCYIIAVHDADLEPMGDVAPVEPVIDSGAMTAAEDED